MAKKKNTSQVINNIGELNLEIDYDKLAQAIVRAQDDANRKNSVTSGALARMAASMLHVVAIVGWLLAAAIPFVVIKMFPSFAWDGVGVVIGNVFSLVTVGTLLVVSVFYSVLLWKSAKEIETEKDRNYIISVFSGIVSFAALIVALVALFDKGVG